MTSEKVRFVQAATPEEFFAQIRKAHKDVYEKEKEKRLNDALNNHGPLGTNMDAYDKSCEDTENSDRS